MDDSLRDSERDPEISSRIGGNDPKDSGRGEKQPERGADQDAREAPDKKEGSELEMSKSLKPSGPVIGKSLNTNKPEEDA